jgi:hypothetical protein
MRRPVVKWLLIPTLVILLSSCGAIQFKSPAEPPVVVKTEYVERQIPIQQRPAPVQMVDVQWYVVNQNNLEEFLTRIKNDSGEVVFMAVSPKGYENLAVGISDLRRYILQQKEIIVYYEEQLLAPQPQVPVP